MRIVSFGKSISLIFLYSIVDNMAKLVDSHITVRPFLPSLLPGLLKVESAIGDPEARSVVARAITTLRQVGQVPEGDGSDLPPLKHAEGGQLAHSLVQIYKKLGAEISPGNLDTMYASALAANLVNSKNFEVPQWETLAPYLTFITTTPEPVTVAREWVVRSATEGTDDEDVPEDEEEGEDLCNCQFSLAYGAKILLNTAVLRLKRGHRYGLCGKNGTGKSTLMRAITNGQVEGFPSPDEVRTFYVEHDIDGSEEDTSVLEFILTDKRILATKENIIETLASVGFSDERQAQAIGSLSGGWKMKLALARAMLFKADILLLDEPTNHLDVVNVAWLENYLTNLKTCTSSAFYSFFFDVYSHASVQLSSLTIPASSTTPSPTSSILTASSFADIVVTSRSSFNKFPRPSPTTLLRLLRITSSSSLIPLFLRVSRPRRRVCLRCKFDCSV